MASEILTATSLTGSSAFIWSRISFHASSASDRYCSHDLCLYYTFSLESSSNATSLSKTSSSFSPSTAMSMTLPVYGSSLLSFNLLTQTFTSHSRMTTKDGFYRIVLSSSIQALLIGYPSKTHPLSLQSLYWSLCSTREMMISSGTYFPFAIAV